jgi:hypothetical protein
MTARKTAEQNSKYLLAALEYAELGLPVIPLYPRRSDVCGCGDLDCRNQEKHPIGDLARNGFKSATTDPDTIRRWWRRFPEAGIGIPSGAASDIIVIDVDQKNGKDGSVALAELTARLGPLPPTWTATTPSNGRHLWFKNPGNIRCSNGKLGIGLDVKGDGGYIVAPPSHDLYHWDDDDDAALAALPDAWVAHLRSLDAVPTGQPVIEAAEPLATSANLQAEPDLVARALKAIPNNFNLGRDAWTRVGLATYAATSGSEEGRRLFDEWSREWFFYNEVNTAKLWDSFTSSPPNRIGAGTLIHLADKASPGWRGETISEPDQKAIDELADLGTLDYERTRKEAAEKLGVRRGILDRKVEEWRAAKRQKLAATPPAPPTREELAEQCPNIITSTDILALFTKEISRVVTGEQLNMQLLYLVGTSRLFDKTMHAAVKGTSAVGKSELRKSALRFFPPESKIEFTILSEKALLYEDRGFEHKILSMGEAVSTEDSKLQDYLLRELMSEGVLHYPVVQKNGDVLRTEHIIKCGPVSFMVTSTRNKFNPENETRMLSLEADDSEAQTRAVIDMVARNLGYNTTHEAIDLAPWHAHQRWLAAGAHRVMVPFSQTLGRLIPAKTVRLRRDIGQVMMAIKAHALLHQQQRKRNDAGEIVATRRDYEVARDLLADVLATGAEVAVHRSVEQTVAAVEAICQDAAAPEPGAYDGVAKAQRAFLITDSEKAATVREVGRTLGLERSAAQRRLRKAEDAGLIRNTNEGRGAKLASAPPGYECSRKCCCLQWRS